MGTFGLSIPLCSTVGAVVGSGTGATVCGTAGLVGGGAAGYLGYAHKEEIKHGTTNAINKVGEYKDYGKAFSLKVGSAFAMQRLMRRGTERGVILMRHGFRSDEPSKIELVSNEDGEDGSPIQRE